MTRWIDASPAQRSEITIRDLQGRDFDAEFAAIRAEAEAIKARDDFRNDAQRERALERCRCDWRSVAHAKRLLEINLELRAQRRARARR